MVRHPIKTLKSLLEMGAKSCCLTDKEAKRLIKDYEQLFGMANELRYSGIEGESEYNSTNFASKYGMGEDE